MMGIENIDGISSGIIREFEKQDGLHDGVKYLHQIGLKDLDFQVDYEKVKAFGLRVPFQGINQAEFALRNHVITLEKITEDDATEHQVLHFDHRPIGYSGFMNCVTHSLILTDHGLFEIGRYSAMNLSTEGKFWQWFLHRKLASVEEVNEFCDLHNESCEQFLQEAYRALTND